MEYNTSREPLILKEYGRNVQKLVSFLNTIEDIEERSRLAKGLIHLMKQLNPSVREYSDNMHRAWDHLFVMADFNLDINTPYDKPVKENLYSKPKKVHYNTNQLRFLHYGRNVELLIFKIIEMEDQEEMESAISYVGKLMKSFYATWNRDSVEDDLIISHIKLLSKGKILVDAEKAKAERWFDISGQNFNPATSNTAQVGKFKRSSSTSARKKVYKKRP